jgi:glycosyltransferase involved in cell wall biosynthesis
VFQLIGKGQLYQEIREMAEKLNLKNVEFYPDSNESNSLEMLQNADIFLGFLESNPTALREIPNKVYQGLALGKVVVTGDSPAIRSVFTHGKNICLVPPANAQELAKTIQELATHPAEVEKISIAAFALFQEKFTMKATGEVLREAIAKLLSTET